MLLKNYDLNKLLNYSILLYAFLLPLTRAGINIVGGVILLLWILNKGYKKIEFNKTYFAIFLFGGFMILSLLWTKNFGYWKFYVVKYFHYMILSFVIYLSIKNSKSLINFFIGGLFVSEITSYLIFFGIIHKNGVLPSDPTPFMHHIEYSFYLVIGAIFLIDRFFSVKKWNKEKIFSIIFFITISFNLFIINGRTGQIVYIVVLFLIIVTYFKITLKNIILSILIGVIGFMFLYKVSPNFHHKFNKTIKMVMKLDKLHPCSADGNRIYMLKAGIEIFKENSIIGVGVGDVMDEFKKYVIKNMPYFKCSFRYNHLHNQYIQILVQVGSVGMVIFLSIFYFLFKEAKDKRFAFLVIIAILLSFNGDVLLSRQFSTALISLLIAIVLKKESNDKYSNNSI